MSALTVQICKKVFFLSVSHHTDPCPGHCIFAFIHTSIHPPTRPSIHPSIHLSDIHAFTELMKIVVVFACPEMFPLLLATTPFSFRKMFSFIFNPCGSNGTDPTASSKGAYITQAWPLPLISDWISWANQSQSNSLVCGWNPWEVESLIELIAKL